jgi:Ser-tRNA(Ala) deacylase AlaX
LTALLKGIHSLYLTFFLRRAQQTRTYLAFQYDGKLEKLQASVVETKPFVDLDPATRTLLFKQIEPTVEDHIVVTDQTIFHPQGGGQPSDEGFMRADNVEFVVKTARTTSDGVVLHLGRFLTASTFVSGQVVEQAIDTEKRLYYSRLHTAGHVLGASVRHLLEKEIPNFDELKASHFPESAACEFQGLIEGRWKDPIQKRLDEYIAKAMPVEIDWWDEDDFKREGLDRLIPERSHAAPGEKLRVVKIVGAEVYPCGGTHVDTTDLCGKTTVKKITRQKGNSRVSYAVAPPS